MPADNEAPLPGFSAGDLSPDWTVVFATEIGADLVVELRREVGADHALAGIAVEAVAIHRHWKEFICFLPDERRWAVVHLTWTVEPDAHWPMAMRLPNWQAVVEELADRGRS